MSVALLLAACSPPLAAPPSHDAGEMSVDGGGRSEGPLDGGSDAGRSDVDGGADGDGGTPDGLAPWTWLPVEGSRCASGATAGIAVNASSASDDLFIYLQGGGACWDQGSCVPSLLRHGPVCYYNPGVCLYDGPGGTKPMASHVTHPDPFPADGGGVLASELGLVENVRVFDRSDPENPFRDATFVFVPYCTGDLHAGDAVTTFPYQHDPFGPVYEYTFHFAGATNMERYLEQLVEMRPNAARVWLTGSSAGGYGATLNFERVVAAFPEADVALLADSSPFITPRHWDTWRDTWNMRLPEGCASCELGFPEVMEHLFDSHPERRIGLLAFERDAVVSYFFFGGTGPEAVLTPPTGTYLHALDALLAAYDTRPLAQAFVLPGEEHVMWGGYGLTRDDGDHTAPRPSADGTTDLKTWIDAWATGDAAWTSVR